MNGDWCGRCRGEATTCDCELLDDDWQEPEESDYNDFDDRHVVHIINSDGTGRIGVIQ